MQCSFGMMTKARVKVNRITDKVTRTAFGKHGRQYKRPS
jgi:hypothetical protein